MGGKRDSFKLLGPSSSNKDQLHTLMEEEEEEEEPVGSSKAQESSLSVDSIKENVPPITTTPAVAITKATLSKPRPSTLSLRPLSLTPENLACMTQGLPTPTLTPSPRPGLRSFSLSPIPSLDESSTLDTSSQESRSPLVTSRTPSPRRPILNLALEHFNGPSMPTPEDDAKQARRSSISYKRSSSHGGVTVNYAGLPTPEMTPTFRRSSVVGSVSSASGDDEFFPSPPTQSRPLSASEQHFLFKSHNALLARITDLERALSVRRRESNGYSNGGSSRPLSVTSNMSTSDVSSGNGEPSDEMLCLIADLKSERDELKRDVDGWRTRVADLESQIGVFAKRVENERRDAWVARSRVGLLEVEKATLSKKLEAVDQLIALHDKEKELIDEQRTFLKKENEEFKKRLDALETELELVKQELELEKSKKLTVDPLSVPISSSLDGCFGIKKHGFMSVDSESSTTDVDPDSSDDNFAFSLKVVEEVRAQSDVTDEDDYSEEENVLAGYEDEEDTDISFQSSSSFGSEYESPRSTHHLSQPVTSAPTTPKPSSSVPQVFTPPRATLAMSWTFPKGVQPQIQAAKNEGEDAVDRFFGCLDDGDNSGGSVPNSPSAYSFERSKGIFASGFNFASTDDNASFFLPDDVDLHAVTEQAREGKRLSAVVEEAEENEDDQSEDGVDDSEDMFGEIGGIRITFTPAQEEPEVDEAKQLLVSPVKPPSPPPTLPALNFCDEGADEEEEATIPFNFGRPLVNERQSTPPTVAFPMMMTPPPLFRSSPSIISRPASPSSIPRPIISRPLFSSTESTSGLPFKPSAVPAINFSSSSYITPPTKRGSNLPSFIPQPVSSPSPMRVSVCPSKPGTIPMSTFIRQPVRKPLLPNDQKTVGSSNGSTPSPIIRRSY